MTSHATSYETVSSRGHVGPGVRQQALWGLTLVGVDWRIVDVSSNAIQDPLVPFSGYATPPIQSLDFRTITDNAAIRSLGRAWSGQDTVSLDGSSLDNGTALIQTDSSQGSGRLAPDVFLSTGGGVQTALGALTGTTTGLDINASCGYITETYMGMQHFADFQEQPPDTAASGATRLHDLIDLFEVSAARYQIGVDTNADPVFVEQCGFAAMDPSGVVYIRPEDIGPNALQIPAGIGDNTAAAFRAHPSVFYPSGKSQYVRAVTRQRTDPIDVATTGGVQPLKIISVASAPTSSQWLVTIDGAPMIVTVTHPAGSDFRRPKDIWAGVILPLINTGGANQSDSIYPTVANSVGDAVLTRMEYADYWRCLPIAGTRIIQTGGGG